MRIFCDGGKLIDSGRLVALDELRGLVCWRRASGGSQSDRGNQFAANLKSVIHTCRKQDRHVLSYLKSAIHAALRNRATPSLIAAA